MEATLQSIFRSEFESYRKMHGLSIDQIKAAQAIMDCQRDELGYEEWLCRDDNYVLRQPHSCRHRSCPLCNGSQSREWLEKIKSKLLLCEHYHVVFTLPHELNAIWHYNRRWCADKLFQATAETLRELLKDERYLGGEVGLLSSLHTWGRTQIFHPHMHVLVTGIGLHSDDVCRVENDFLLPVGVLKAKFRGKWLSRLNEAYANNEITLPPEWTELEWRRVLRQVSRKNWNIRIQGAYKHGDGVAIYLSRYVRGGTIKNQQIISADDQRVTFCYKDHHDCKRKTMTLPIAHFMTRVLWHVAVAGQHQVRYYGLYASGAREKRDKVRSTLGVELEKVFEKPDREVPICPMCGHDLMHVISIRRKISYIRNSSVQQCVTTDRDRPVAHIDYLNHETSPPIFCAARRPLN
ncbi:MAG: transposase [Candidatus Thiodiazotropha endolucinida]|uniref:Putative transposase n=1 Tax=Candidatus Thiodiazotropha endolucinida TaxID=1655433 RepID=A0A7Z0VII8_9GAMM|nr:transposase [Candidatus Thiodiazotropha endolucinida]ODJ85849.1 putative transposase [Candidatus Thiodiazotropha endolucinida]